MRKGSSGHIRAVQGRSTSALAQSDYDHQCLLTKSLDTEQYNSEVSRLLNA